MIYQEKTPWEVARKRHELEEELGALEEEISRRRTANRHVTRSEDQDWQSRSARGLRLHENEGSCVLVGPEFGFDVHNFYVFIAQMAPGTQQGAYHKHGEAIKYYLSGSGVEIIEGKRYEVKAGDVGFVPADAWHGTQNTGTEPLRYLAFCPSIIGVPTAVQPVWMTAENARDPGGSPKAEGHAQYREFTPWELGRKRHELLTEMGLVEEELNQRRTQDRHVIRSEEMAWDEHTTTGLKKLPGNRSRRIVAPQLGFNIRNFEIFMAEIGPRTQRGAYHVHGEAVKYYLSGRGIEIIGDKQYEVKAGDTVFIPANVWHGTQNPFDEPVSYLAALSTTPFTMVPSLWRTRGDVKE